MTVDEDAEPRGAPAEEARRACPRARPAGRCEPPQASPTSCASTSPRVFSQSRQRPRCQGANSANPPCAIRSIEECGEALLYAVGNIERQSLDGGGWVHAAGGDPDAAVDDKQVFHIVAATPFVHH